MLRPLGRVHGLRCCIRPGKWALAVDARRSNGYELHPENLMAHVRKDTLVRPPQWWDHLRDWKRHTNHAERRAAVAEIREQLQESVGQERQ